MPYLPHSGHSVLRACALILGCAFVAWLEAPRALECLSSGWEVGQSDGVAAEPQLVRKQLVPWPLMLATLARDAALFPASY